MNNAAKNIFVHIAGEKIHSCLLGIFLWVELVCHITMYLILERNAKQLCKVVASFYTFTSNGRVPVAPHSCGHLVLSFLFLN